MTERNRTLPQPAEWVETHAHLQDEVYASDRAAVLARAEAAGVRQIILATCTYEDVADAIEMARRHPDRLFCAAGCHPHEASGFSRHTVADWRQLIEANRLKPAPAESCAGSPGVGAADAAPAGGPIVAIGEIGLDYHYMNSPRSVQQDVFRRLLDLAYELDLPAVIHMRDATADTLAILSETAEKGRLREQPGVLHCYSGSAETAQIVLNMGFMLGFDGPVTFKTAHRLREVVAGCPKDRLLLETDCPYLTPEPHRGTRNEPAYLPYIGAKVAEIWGCTPEEAAAVTTANARRLFRLHGSEKQL